MASVYKCDRCGKEIDCKRNSWVTRIGVKRAKLFMRGEDFQRYEYDLCGECGKELLDWANGVKRVKK